MGILQTLLGTAKCPECRGVHDPTDWKPSPGLEGMMRQFKCRSCHCLFYFTARDGEQLLNIKERRKAMEKRK